MKKEPSFIALLGIMSMYLISMGVTVVTPAMATLYAAFPDQNVALVSTLPTLFTTIASLAIGVVLGKQITYKMTAIIGSVLFLIGGVYPAFTDSFTMVLVGRAILGLGLGFMSPLANALLIGCYDGQKQAKLLGYGTLLMNAGGIVYQQLGGHLANLGWHQVFYGHLFGLVGLVGALFLPEPQAAPAAAGPKNTGAKAPLGTAAIIVAALFFIFNVLNYPAMMNLSVLFEQRNAGGSTAAANALSLYTVFGCISGFIYGYTSKILGRFTAAAGFLLSALGAFLLYIGGGNVVMTIGLCMIGFAFSILMPTGFAVIGMRTNPLRIAFATSLSMALMNLGGFACTYWLSIVKAITGNSLEIPVLLEAIILAIIGVIFIVVNPYPAQKN